MSASLIGRLGSSTFRLPTTSVSMSLTGSRFSSDSAPRALPSWDSKTRWNNLSGDLAVNVTAGSSGHTNSPHSSSREGHHSTVGGARFPPIALDPAQISSCRAGSVVLAGLILGGCQSQHCSDCLRVPEAGWHIDRDAIGQRDHRPDTRDGHQAAAHIIVPDDGQQAAMQDAELLANDPPDNEQRFHQHGQIGNALDKLPNTHLVLDRPDRADLETEVAQGGTQIVLDGNGL